MAIKVILLEDAACLGTALFSNLNTPAYGVLEGLGLVVVDDLDKEKHQKDQSGNYKELDESSFFNID